MILGCVVFAIIPRLPRLRSGPSISLRMVSKVESDGEPVCVPSRFSLQTFEIGSTLRLPRLRSGQACSVQATPQQVAGLNNRIPARSTTLRAGPSRE